MTARDLLPGVYRVLLEAAYDISDSMAVLRDIDEGFLEYDTDQAKQSRAKRERNKIRKRRDQARNDVREELEAAGRADLVGLFMAFVDKYLARLHAGRLVEELFNTER